MEVTINDIRKLKIEIEGLKVIADQEYQAHYKKGEWYRTIVLPGYTLTVYTLYDRNANVVDCDDGIDLIDFLRGAREFIDNDLREDPTTEEKITSAKIFDAHGKLLERFE